MQSPYEDESYPCNEGLCLVLRAYFDDSGSESLPSQPFVCLAGFLAYDQFWLSFNRQWRQCLLRNNISCVHMKDLIPLQGEYQRLGWDETKRDSVISEFVQVIRDNQLIGVGVGVDSAAWRSLEGKNKKHFSVQHFCFVRVLRLIVERMKKADPREWVAIHFDSNPEFGAGRLHLFDEIRTTDENARWFFPSITFADMRTYHPLQAADILAWETRKELIQKIGGYASNPRYAKLMAALGDTGSLYSASELWDKAELEREFLKEGRQ